MISGRATDINIHTHTILFWVGMAKDLVSKATFSSISGVGLGSLLPHQKHTVADPGRILPHSPQNAEFAISSGWPTKILDLSVCQYLLVEGPRSLPQGTPSRTH